MFIGQIWSEGGYSAHKHGISIIPNMIGVVSEIALWTLALFAASISVSTLGWAAISLGASAFAMKIVSHSLKQSPTTRLELIVHGAVSAAIVAFGVLGISYAVTATQLGFSLRMTCGVGFTYSYLGSAMGFFSS